MRVFVTGASGFVGSAVVKELLSQGHKVTGLARSDASAETVAALGAEVHRGSLEDLDSLRSGADKSDGVMHLGFVHDFSKYQENCEIDRRAIEAMADALAGSDRALVVTSGTGLVRGKLAVETDAPLDSASMPRAAGEEATQAAAKRGVRAMIMRLPQVHGDGDHGFVPLLAGISQAKGAAAYIGDGANRWPAVHRFDCARLYRLAFEKGARGAAYHAVGEEGIAAKDIAAAIGRQLKLPVVSKKPEEAFDHFGWFAMFAGMDNPSSSAITRKALGWEPKEVGLLADIDRPGYFSPQVISHLVKVASGQA